MAPGQPIERYMSELSERPSLYIDVPAPRSNFSTFAVAPQYSSPKSASSATSSRRSSASDGGSLLSSAPTSATSISSPSIGTMEQPRYWLQCTFRETDCRWKFHPDDYATWYSHCLSHWNGHPPPRDCLCIFCDKFFQGSDGWRRRMSHIAMHLANGSIVENSRPDFALYRYMREKGLLSKSDHADLTEYSECQTSGLGLLPLNYRTEKAPSRNDVVSYDQRKEDRERNRSQKGKGKARESKHHHRN